MFTDRQTNKHQSKHYAAPPSRCLTFSLCIRKSFMQSDSAYGDTELLA